LCSSRKRTHSKQSTHRVGQKVLPHGGQRTEKRERKNEKRKAQLENFKKRKKMKLAKDTKQLQK
jgi:hypothetical protein